MAVWGRVGIWWSPLGLVEDGAGALGKVWTVPGLMDTGLSGEFVRVIQAD